MKIKRLLRKHHYPSVQQRRAVDLIVGQAEFWTNEMLVAQGDRG